MKYIGMFCVLLFLGACTKPNHAPVSINSIWEVCTFNDGRTDLQIQRSIDELNDSTQSFIGRVVNVTKVSGGRILIDLVAPAYNIDELKAIHVFAFLEPSTETYHKALTIYRGKLIHVVGNAYSVGIMHDVCRYSTINLTVDTFDLVE